MKLFMSFFLIFIIMGMGLNSIAWADGNPTNKELLPRLMAEDMDLSIKNFSSIDNNVITVVSNDTQGNQSPSETKPTGAQARDSSQACDWEKSGTEKYAGDLGQNWSAGPVVSYSLVQYNLADKRSSFNAKSLGAGISFRRYRDRDLRWFAEKKLNKVSSIEKKTADVGLLFNTYPEGNQWSENVSISDIPAGCRAQSTDLLAEGNKIVAWISVSPTMYVFQEENADKLGVQMALNFGFLNDIFNIGVGWNLSGQNAGEWFLLIGPSYGFRF